MYTLKSSINGPFYKWKRFCDMSLLQEPIFLSFERKALCKMTVYSDLLDQGVKLEATVIVKYEGS